MRFVLVWEELIRRAVQIYSRHLVCQPWASQYSCVGKVRAKDGMAIDEVWTALRGDALPLPINIRRNTSKSKDYQYLLLLTISASGRSSSTKSCHELPAERDATQPAKPYGHLNPKQAEHSYALLAII